jgi:hypothetical protein
MKTDEDEIDDGYGQLLAEIGRSEDDDQSVACHEAAHCLAWLLLNSDPERKIAEVTITPGDGYEGRVRGERQIKTYAARDIDASDVRGVLEPLMPSAGENRANVADVFASTYHQCIEFVSGRIGQEMFGDGSTSGAADDYRQARELAALFCKSAPAIDTFIAHCEAAARDLLAPYWYVLLVLSIVLKIRRVLTGDEVIKIVADTVARFELAAERAKRRQWQQTIERAKEFSELTING